MADYNISDDLDADFDDRFANYSNDDHSGGSYDYFDISFRASYFFKEPHRIIALILVAVVVASNIFSLAAILKIHGKLNSHFRFLVSLALSDILVALSVLLHVVNKVVNPMYRPGVGPETERLVSRCGFVIIKALNSTGLIITLLNLMGMSIDAFLAIMKPSYYISAKNFTRATWLIIGLWSVAIACGFSDFVFSLHGAKGNDKWQYRYNYCEFVWLSKYHEEYTVFAIAILCLVTLTYLYGRIYFQVKKHQRPGDNAQQRRNRNTNRSRRILFTTIIIIITFIVCWLPLCILNISMIVITKVNSELIDAHVSFFQNLAVAERYLYNMLLLNGIFDPVIYTVRIPEVKQSYRKFLCGKSALNGRNATSYRSAAERSGGEQEEESILVK